LPQRVQRDDGDQCTERIHRYAGPPIAHEKARPRMSAVPMTSRAAKTNRQSPRPRSSARSCIPAAVPGFAGAASEPIRS
jgi:hypothetical protein